MAGNKTVFLMKSWQLYMQQNNVVMLELVYNGYFGKGHNVTHRDLKEQGLFTTYPYQLEYNKEQFVRILEMGGVDVQNVIIN